MTRESSDDDDDEEEERFAATFLEERDGGDFATFFEERRFVFSADGLRRSVGKKIVLRAYNLGNSADSGFEWNSNFKTADEKTSKSLLMLNKITDRHGTYIKMGD